jgi:hypothetical protein
LALLGIEAVISTEPQNDFKAQAPVFKPPGLFFCEFHPQSGKLPGYKQVKHYA